MGICCAGTNSYVTSITHELLSLNVSHLQYPFIKSLLYPTNTIPPTHLISNEHFLEIASNNFFTKTNPFHLSLFTNLLSNSNQHRSFLYAYMVFLSKSSIDDKLNEFIESIFTLANASYIKYIMFKQHLTHFITCALLLPIQSYKETLNPSAHQISHIEDIDKALHESYSEHNINSFVDYLCEGFESMKIGEQYDDDSCIELIKVYPNNIAEDIFGERKNFCFDWVLLREAFAKRFGVEECKV